MHRCHANGCADDAHPEMPFCKRHANMLPEPHKKRLWVERARGKCGACEIADEGDDHHRGDDWVFLYHLAVAMLLLIEYGNDSLPPSCGCGAPPVMRDDDGFCWGCGVDGADRTYGIARKAIAKYNIQL